MEILSSTDIIGEEIKEEARKKAAIIIKNADDEIKRLQSKSSEKIAQLKVSQEELYASKIQKYRQDVFVRLPLKKLKSKMEYIECLFTSASDKYFASLPINSKLFIIKNVLKKYQKVLQNREVVVKYAGFPQEKVYRLVFSLFPDCNIKEVREASSEEVRRLLLDEGVAIEDVERTFVCKASIEGAKALLFDEKKKELCETLCGVEETL